jgi:hypothetical protein
LNAYPYDDGKVRIELMNSKDSSIKYIEKITDIPETNDKSDAKKDIAIMKPVGKMQRQVLPGVRKSAEKESLYKCFGFPEKAGNRGEWIGGLEYAGRANNGFLQFICHKNALEDTDKDGYSGAPIANENDNVVAMFQSTQENEGNIIYAIPVNTILSTIDNLEVANG